MKKVLLLALPVVFVACSEAPTTSPDVRPAFAAGDQGGPRPTRGDVTGATPDTYNAQWVTGTSEDGGAKGESIKMTSTAPDIAYYSFRNWWDHSLASVTKIEASFLAAPGTVNSGGSPRFSLIIDSDGAGPGDADVVVYLDPAHCSNLANSGWRNSDFTGDRTDCAIYTSASGIPYTSDANGTAWSKVVAAYPAATVYFMFLIQDATTGTNYVDRIKLDAAFFTNKP